MNNKEHVVDESKHKPVKLHFYSVFFSTASIRKLQLKLATQVESNLANEN